MAVADNDALQAKTEAIWAERQPLLEEKARRPRPSEFQQEGYRPDYPNASEPAAPILTAFERSDNGEAVVAMLDRGEEPK
jgi:hypothetical protein